MYGNATRLQADDGSDRGHARVLLRWAEVPVGSFERGSQRRARAPAAARAPRRTPPVPISIWLVANGAKVGTL